MTTNMEVCAERKAIEQFGLEQERLWISGMPPKAFDIWSRMNDPEARRAKSHKETVHA